LPFTHFSIAEPVKRPWVTLNVFCWLSVPELLGWDLKPTRNLRSDRELLWISRHCPWQVGDSVTALARLVVVSYPGGGLRNQLAHLGAEAVHAGLVVGSGGNLSARAPGSDRCWITAAGSWLDRLGPTDFSLIDISGGQLQDGHPRPSSEWRLHTETYRRRPDVNAIVHLHPQVSVLLTALGHDIALMTTDHAYYLREIATVEFDLPGGSDLAIAAADAVANGVNALILGHHGCSVLADSVELAHKRAVNLEEAARSTYAALLLSQGQPARIPGVPAGFLDAVQLDEARI
jgi:ribulose-5-phosphate 4-epimerase/fuculose-1-phosphate aldolase